MARPTPAQKRASALHLARLLLREWQADGPGLQPHLRELLSILIWKWTEAHGKYRGCRFWTPRALEAPQGLCHEHVVPRKLLVEALVAAGPESAEEILETMAVACVVTHAEHSQLPDVSWEELLANPWARYDAAGVEVVDTLESIDSPGR